MFTTDDVRFVARRLREIVEDEGPVVAQSLTMEQVAAHLPADLVKKLDAMPSVWQQMFADAVSVCIAGGDVDKWLFPSTDETD